ncbi:MAG: hotdog fold thioesterase [Flavobacteriales bacterium]
MIDPDITLEKLNGTSKNTMIEHLGIEYTEIGERHLWARMPVDNRTVQPQEFLHGGASAALAETVGSLASFLMIDRERFTVRGLSITADHVGGVQDGYVHARAELVHEGRSMHLWDIHISSDTGKTVSLCRLTTKVVPLDTTS